MIKRALALKVNTEKIMFYDTFLEAVMCLIKKKYKSALKHLKAIEQKISKWCYHLMYFEYRAYAYLCLFDHENALNDYNYIDAIKPLDPQQ